MNNSSSSLYTCTAESLVTAAAVVGVVGAAHRELGGEQHHGEHQAPRRAGPTKDQDLSGYEAHQVK